MNDIEQRIVKLLPKRMKNADGEVLSSDLDDLICAVALVIEEFKEEVIEITNMMQKQNVHLIDEGLKSHR